MDTEQIWELTKILVAGFTGFFLAEFRNIFKDRPILQVDSGWHGEAPKIVVTIFSQQPRALVDVKVFMRVGFKWIDTGHKFENGHILNSAEDIPAKIIVGFTTYEIYLGAISNYTPTPGIYQIRTTVDRWNQRKKIDILPR